MNKTKIVHEAMREPKYLEALDDILQYVFEKEKVMDGLSQLEELFHIRNEALKFHKELGEHYESGK